MEEWQSRHERSANASVKGLFPRSAYEQRYRASVCERLRNESYVGTESGHSKNLYPVSISPHSLRKNALASVPPLPLFLPHSALYCLLVHRH